MILDTSFLIDLMHGEDQAREKLAALEAETVPVKMSSLSAFELFYGAERYVEPDEERQKIVAALDEAGAGRVGLSWETGRRAGKIKAELERDGRSIGAVDILIAATALEEETPLLTGNPDHFDRVPGLDVETY
ncbi:MAG: PIN domain-containing protein [Candidatus Nanohaloarchaea archaeon]|nr:PIN domain-containing protein [Candidatus Nanohaloarchaea archaeon]